MTELEAAERRRVETAIETCCLEDVEWHVRNLVHLTLREELRRTDIAGPSRIFLALDRVRATLLPLARVARERLKVGA